MEMYFFLSGHFVSCSQAASLAHLNASSIRFSVSPTYLPFKSPGDGVKNNTPTFGSLLCNSFTDALIKYVLPVPGGPYIKIPLAVFGYKLG